MAEINADRTVFMGTDHIDLTTSVAIRSPRGRGRRRAHVYWPDGFFGSHRMTVLTAESGAAGVSLYKARQADISLVLLDYSMPEMGGEETFKELRTLNPEVPILLSSGFGREEATRRFEGLRLTGFIQKPYRLATLLAEVRRCLGTGCGSEPPWLSG